MATGVVAIGFAIAIAATAISFLIQPKGNNDSLSPNIDDFSPTTVKEGTVVPVVYGRVRVRGGNLIHWGNLRTVAIKQKTGGKGGSTSQSQTTGFKFFADVWQTVCIGKVSLIDTLIDDKSKAIEASAQLFNDGTQSTVPSFTGGNGDPLEFASSLNPIAHIALTRWFLGENVSTIPTIDFVVERDLSMHPINNANMANGNNPAAVIYDGLILMGVSIAKINVTTFNDAADYFFTKGYALNFSLDTQGTLADMIKKVLGWVDAVLFRDELGRFSLRALKETDTSVSTITEEDMNKFTLNRKTWRQVPNEFIGTFIDGSDDGNFKQATVKTINPAAIRLARRTISSSRDFKCFRDVETASKRITEVMKRESYPASFIKISTNYKYSTLLPGDIITVSHADYGIVSADFRITRIDTSQLSQNNVEIEAIQFSESLFDDIFLTAGGGQYGLIKQDLQVTAFTHVKVFELPYNSITGFEPSFLILAAREKGFETSYIVQFSDNASADFESVEEYTTFSMHGTLNADYSGDGTTIDDTVGVDFTFFNFDPEFDNLSRQQLFATPRIAIVNDEIMLFQNITLTGTSTATLTGVVRGLFHTPVQSHSAGDEIWLTTIADNVLQNIPYDSFFVKVLPKFVDNIVSPGAVAAESATKQNKALEPRNVGRIRAVKVGSNVDLQLHPSIPGIPGAGDLSPVEAYGGAPYNIGDAAFEVTGDVPATPLQYSDSFTVTPTTFPATITIKTVQNNKFSSGISVTIQNVDGVYKA